MNTITTYIDSPLILGIWTVVLIFWTISNLFHSSHNHERDRDIDGDAPSAATTSNENPTRG